MKFGQYLATQKVPEWQSSYLDYDALKTMISKLEELHIMNPQNTGEKGASLSISRPTNAAGMPTQRLDSGISQEDFYAFLEREMRKIEQFTKHQVELIRRTLSEAEGSVGSLGSGTSKNNAEMAALQRSRVEKAGEDFLKLEKYVNMNFTGFHKILKKHDRRLPNPCKAFYTSRLHDQSWVRGDYSDVIVSMSRVYSALRGDEEVEAKEEAAQNFVRSTRKYWVHTENISSIKYTILQHLPVFLQNTMAGEVDSQLVNSVYLDNSAMELYHGRLEKSPGAIALRFRWYGTGIPELVFVERKTHRESWAGEVSVKERFIIKENQVKSLLQGKFDVQGELERLKAKGKGAEELREWYELVREVIQAINSKQLVPTMRTQYMRTAFQIPFDATVRVSLDTNLCMISERTKETTDGQRWFRDPSIAVPLNEITRFPHGVLEVKLQLQEGNDTPEWVSDMLLSGKLLEVHKFSKFIHGSSVIMPEDVRAVPYWIDDATLADSIRQSGAAHLLVTSAGANQVYQHLLPHDSQGKVKGVKETAKPVPRVEPSQRERLDSSTLNALDSIQYQRSNMFEDDVECLACEWAQPFHSDRMTVQKVEPKLFFANERTFIKWLHMAVVISSISIAVLAFTSDTGQAQFYAIVMMPLSLVFIGYALTTFLWRSEKIKTRDTDRWDDPFGPILLCSLLIAAMLVQLYFKVSEILENGLD
ncbi:VTC domain-containing protein [Ochromonadaceae sp. CCMP2298]|nr:VTC domain-containing protein [Ochromonadaceae sp. CCMP2298]|mmetsp:Transcript_34319/g.75638  ORF Transcript_34319/g.75638 Transcript_34319/m.75638 type:complete len:704 (-) Transcript_34319:186-2297(-)